MNVDLTLNLYNVLAIVFAAGVLWTKVQGIEKKLDEFLPRREAEAKVAVVQAAVNGLQRRVDDIVSEH